MDIIVVVINGIRKEIFDMDFTHAIVFFIGVIAGILIDIWASR
jgi:hypothetical protein